MIGNDLADMWVIYRSADPAFLYTLRRLIIEGGRVTGETELKVDRRSVGITDESGLEGLRDTLQRHGLTRIERDPDDDPAVLETWI